MTRPPRDLPGLRGETSEKAMKAVIKEAFFYVVASAIILPTPTLIFAYMTNKTLLQILYR